MTLQCVREKKLQTYAFRDNIAKSKPSLTKFARHNAE